MGMPAIAVPISVSDVPGVNTGLRAGAHGALTLGFDWASARGGHLSKR